MNTTRLPLMMLFLLPACSTDSASPSVCGEGKCDDPGSAADRECAAAHPNDREAEQACRDERALQHCELRRADALGSAQRAFVPDAIRWAAADVEGVNSNFRDDRGQEYTEYFAVIAPPPVVEGDPTPESVALGQNREGGGSTAPGIELSDDQIFALEDEADAVVGQCIFTSWHMDIREPLPICGDSEFDCPTLTMPENRQLPSWMESSDLGLRMTADNFKMKIGFNSNVAASDLAERCMTDPLVGDPEDSDDPLNDDYIRGCMKAYSLFKTEWRRSDSAVCVAGGRLAECGCGVDTDGDGVADITDPVEISVALVPRQPVDGEISLRGFPLGTWSGPKELPAGCRYVDTGDSSQTLVSCDLSAADVLAGASDLKGTCRDKYGDNVVVHVPIPSQAVVCSPDSNRAYSDDCSEMPWVL